MPLSGQPDLVLPPAVFRWSAAPPTVDSRWPDQAWPADVVTTSGLGFQGVAQEELQPVQPDLRLLTQLAAQSRCLDRTLTQSDKLFQQFATSTVLLLLDIVEYPQRRSLTDPHLSQSGLMTLFGQPAYRLSLPQAQLTDMLVTATENGGKQAGNLGGDQQQQAVASWLSPGFSAEHWLRTRSSAPHLE